MNLLSFFLKCLVFVGMTFVFIVLFQNGPHDFLKNSEIELSYWQSKLFGATPEATPEN